MIYSRLKHLLSKVRAEEIRQGLFFNSRMNAAPRVVNTSFCPRYHPIRGTGVYDTSGGLLDLDGVWHVWEDDGGWSHFASHDLVHWSGSLLNGTGFGGLTGSISPTSSGVYALWKQGMGTGPPIVSAVATSPISGPFRGASQWQHRGPSILKPASATKFGDASRAFRYPSVNGSWWAGVGCGHADTGAGFCLFQADDDTLQHFTDSGTLFSAPHTYGSKDDDVVWSPVNISTTIWECPDLFPLGDSGRWVLLGSLLKTNQWWVGKLQGMPPRFVAEAVGILDWGNGYAARSGGGWIQTSSDRRLLWSFTGWVAPSFPTECGRALIIPRDLRLRGTFLEVEPIPEIALLRKSSTRRVVRLQGPNGIGLASEETHDVAAGAQVEIRVLCNLSASALHTNGSVAVRTLATADGRAYTEVGVDFGVDSRNMYADHSRCCAKPNSVVQRAPLAAGNWFELLVLVDGGMIESFSSGVALTPLVAPDDTATPADDRLTTVVNSLPGATCEVQSWQLAL